MPARNGTWEDRRLLSVSELTLIVIEDDSCDAAVPEYVFASRRRLAEYSALLVECYSTIPMLTSNGSADYL